MWQHRVGAIQHHIFLGAGTKIAETDGNGLGMVPSQQVLQDPMRKCEPPDQCVSKKTDYMRSFRGPYLHMSDSLGFSMI